MALTFTYARPLIVITWDTAQGLFPRLWKHTLPAQRMNQKCWRVNVQKSFRYGGEISQLPHFLGGEKILHHVLELHSKSCWALVTHSSNWLDNPPIIGFLVFPVSLAHLSSGVSWDQLLSKTTYAQILVSGSAFGETQAKTSLTGCMWGLKEMMYAQCLAYNSS